MATRLATVAPGLADELAARSEAELRRVAERAVVAALEGTQIEDERSRKALAALRAGRYGDTAERAMAKAWAEELDDGAWSAQDQVEKGQATETEYENAFRSARAATALWFALDADPYVAAFESVYEADAALDDVLINDVISDPA